MKSERSADHLRAVARQLNHERVGLATTLEEASQLFRTLRKDDRDPRLKRLGEFLDAARERLEPWPEAFDSALDDLAEQIAKGTRLAKGRLTQLSRALVEPRELEWPGRLLEAVLEATPTERGFLVLYLPGAKEAVVVDRRGFITDRLDGREHIVSRNVVQQTLDQRTTQVIDDALTDPELGVLESVQWLQLRSVLAVPLADHAGIDQPLGVLYLENQQIAGAFDQQAQRLAELAAGLATLLVRTLGLGPTLEKASAPTPLISTDAPSIVTHDPAMKAVLEQARRAAEGPAPVLILGESGTGKELVAREIRARSPRSEKGWVAINCAAIPKELLEGQLFGYVKGAFTGAAKPFRGLLADAHDGTLFLDEIGELDPSLQAKLLRVLQTGEVQRLGSTATERIDLRLIAATSRDLEQGMHDGTFLEALYYRLAVVTLELPPLRQRRTDIVPLLEHFLARHGPAYGRQLVIDPAAAAWLKRYDFPGNVRQLENFAQRFLSLIPKDETCIRLGDLPREVLNLVAVDLTPGDGRPDRLFALPLVDRADLDQRRHEIKTRLDVLEGELVERTIERNQGNKAAAAEELGVHRDTLYEILKRLEEARAASR